MVNSINNCIKTFNMLLRLYVYTVAVVASSKAPLVDAGSDVVENGVIPLLWAQQIF